MSNSLKTNYLTLMGGGILVFLIASLAVSCAKDPLSEEKNNCANGGGDAVPAEESYVHNPADYADISGLDPEEYLVGFDAEICRNSGKTTIDVTSGGVSNIPSYWASGDEVRIFCKDKSGNWKSSIYKYNIESKKLAPASTDLYPGNEVLPAGSTYYAYYPVDLVIGDNPDNSGNISVDITAINKCLGKSTSGNAVTITNAPMACCFVGKAVAKFFNLGYLLVVQDYGYEYVKKITVSSSNDISSENGVVSVSGPGEPATMTLGTGGVKSLSIDLDSAPIQLDNTNPVNFCFVLPKAEGALSNFNIEVTYSKTIDATTYTPSKTLALGALSNVAVSHIQRVRFSHCYFSGGTGTSSDPYRIAKPADLEELSSLTVSENEQEAFFASAYYSQTAAIDLGTSNANFTPIGTSDRPFMGTYNGQNKNISNLAIDGELDYQALFGFTGSSSYIGNVKMVSPTITARHALASIIGKMSGGTLENCSATGCQITASNSQAGGLVAEIAGGSGAQILNCSCDGNLSGTSNVGGIVGYNSDIYDSSLTISDCSFGSNTSSISITGGYLAGGIAACLYGGTVENCSVIQGTTVTATNSSGTDSDIGGIVGKTFGTSVSGCTANATISADKYYAGGIVGYATQVSTYSSSVSGCEFYGSVTGSNTGVGGIVGRVDLGSTVSTCNLKEGASVVSKTYSGGIVGYLYQTANTDLGVSSCNCEGNVTSTAYGAGGIVGSFHGGKINGCAVSRIAKIESTGTDGSATDTNPGSDVGGAVGRLQAFENCTLDNCAVYGCEVSGKITVGGLVGRIASHKSHPTSATKIINCAVMGTKITASGSTDDTPPQVYVGGFLGRVWITVGNIDIHNSFTAPGKITSTQSSAQGVGGFAGVVDAPANAFKVKNSYSYVNDSNVLIGGAAPTPSSAGGYNGNVFGQVINQVEVGYLHYSNGYCNPSHRPWPDATLITVSPSGTTALFNDNMAQGLSAEVTDNLVYKLNLHYGEFTGSKRWIQSNLYPVFDGMPADTHPFDGIYNIDADIETYDAGDPDITVGESL